MSSRVRLVAGAFSVLAMIAGVACSGEDESGASASGADTTSAADTVEEAGPDGYCAVVAEVLSSASTPSTTPEGTEDPAAGLVAAVRGYVDLRHTIEDLREAAPEEISDDWETVSETFSTMPELGSPLEWLAGALFTALDATVAFERIDEVTSEQCGETLFTFDPAAMRDFTTPYVDDEGYTVVDPYNVFGDTACDPNVRNAGLLTAIDETMLVVDCLTTIVGLDLDDYKVAWTVERTPVRPDPPSPIDTSQFRAANTKAKVLVLTDMDVKPASGFDTERRDAVVRGIDLTDGSELYRLTLPRPDGVADLELGFSYGESEPAVEAVGADGTAIVTMEWPMLVGDHQFRMYGISADGQVAWEREIGHSASLFLTNRNLTYVDISHPNAPDEIIEIATGRNVLPAGLPWAEAYGEGCSPIFAVQTRPEQYTGNDTLLVFDAATGEHHTMPFSGSVFPTSTGVLVQPDGVGGNVETIFVTPKGEAWRIGAGLVRSVTTRYGRLFIENQSGHLLEVDQGSGEPLSDAAVEPPPTGILTDDGLLETESSGGAGFRIKASDEEVRCG